MNIFYDILFRPKRLAPVTLTVSCPCCREAREIRFSDVFQLPELWYRARCECGTETIWDRRAQVVAAYLWLHNEFEVVQYGSKILIHAFQNGTISKTVTLKNCSIRDFRRASPSMLRRIMKTKRADILRLALIMQ